ncbi:MAG: hypothetical protein IRZ05_17030 [Micromonosporaceae bacterium]|jgi:hypothetical protein|nr:hypothetical protein [Micromonosporaceae bacterium]
MTRTRTALVVLVGLLALAPPAPASAVPNWVEAPCATGGITRYAGGVDGVVSFAGWIRPCGETSSDAGFGIMLYRNGVAMLLRRTPSEEAVRPYEPPPAPTAFTVDYDLDTPGRRLLDQRYGALRAICVARGHRAPVACVGVDRPAGGGTPLVTPIPTDDPRVMSAGVIERLIEPKMDPACGNCV